MKNAKWGPISPPSAGVFKRIFAIILPVSASSYLRNGLITLENTMIPAGLKKHGASTEGSLSVFGMLKGMVMPILFFPAAFLSSFTSLLIPEISEANAVKNKRRISSIASRAFQITLLFSIVMTSIYICFSDELGLAIYHSKDCGHLLKLLAPLVPLMYLDNVVDGMLKGLGEQLSTLRTNTIDSVIRIGLIWWLIPMKGVEGYLIVLYFSNVLNSLLSISRLVKVSQIKLNVSCWILRPALCAALSSLSVSLSFRLIPHFLSQPAWFMAIEQIAATLLLYALLLPITGCLTARTLDGSSPSSKHPPDAVNNLGFPPHTKKRAFARRLTKRALTGIMGLTDTGIPRTSHKRVDTSRLQKSARFIRGRLSVYLQTTVPFTRKQTIRRISHELYGRNETRVVGRHRCGSLHGRKGRKLGGRVRQKRAS